MKKAGYRETFIFIAGATPQVITETIYALAMMTPPVHPDEIYIITTKTGEKMIEDALIKSDVMKNLTEEYNLPSFSLKETSFVLPVDSSGNPLNDIRNESENEAIGNLITSFIKEKSSNMATRLHCSIAGGRKTMSFYLGSAMQLFGRQWDKLYHVLVTPEFESNPEFFYKPKKDKVIKANGKSLNTKDAEITLAELPFIRLRNKLSLEGSGFRELVDEGQKEIDIAMVLPELKVKLSEGMVSIGQKTIKLTPVQLMIYTAYLKQKLNRCKFSERSYCLDCTECFPSLLELATKPALEEMAKDYMIVCPSRVNDLLYKHKEGLSPEIIRQAISKIKKAMNEQLNDETMTSYYSITTSLRGYSNTKHGVRVEKSKIRMES